MINKLRAYEPGRDRDKDLRLILTAFLLFALHGVVCQLLIGWYNNSYYVSTLLAFSYLKNGFIRRGLEGTLYDLVCRLIPSAFSWKGAFWFAWAMNAVYFASLLAFVRWILGKLREKEVRRGAFFFVLICLAFLVPTACFYQGALGRADLLQMVLCLLQIRLLVERKHEWLTVPLCAVNVLLHEGYLLMTFCAVLIVLLYRALCSREQRGKYLLLTALQLAVVAVLTPLSLRGGSAAHSPEGYEAVRETAALLNVSGGVQWDLLEMMYGWCPEGAPVIDEPAIVAQELQELPIFLVCFLPAFFVFGKGLAGLFRQAGGKRRAAHAAAVLLGPMLIGVEYLTHCDFGRYLFWLIFYYFTTFLSLAAMDDDGAKGALREAYGYSNTGGLLVVALMMIYQPLPICGFTFISRQLLHVFYP